MYMILCIWYSVYVTLLCSTLLQTYNIYSDLIKTLGRRDGKRLRCASHYVCTNAQSTQLDDESKGYFILNLTAIGPTDHRLSHRLWNMNIVICTSSCTYIHVSYIHRCIHTTTHTSYIVTKDIDTDRAW